MDENQNQFVQAQSPNQPRHYSLYILKLEAGKYYIGITTMSDPQKRVAQHKRGYYSAAWTKKYKPVETVSIEDLGLISEAQAKQIENKRTLEYMRLYHYQNVRGGKFNYSGKYVKVGSRFWRDEDWNMLLSGTFMLFALLVAIAKLT